MRSVLRTIDTWLTESESSYLATDSVSIADLAVFQELKQVSTFGDVSIDAQQFSKLASWYASLDASWNERKLKGRE